MPRIPDSVKEQVQSADLVGILQREGLELKKTGQDSYACCCPFHGEKTPSFHVRPAHGYWKCFGCGKGGDAIAFMREKYGMGYTEAVEHLAAILGIKYEKREETTEEQQERLRKETLIAANAVAAEWYRARLADASGAKAYIKSRGWDDEVIEAFGVGFAPKGGGLLGYMVGAGWKEKILMDAGLVKRNEETGRLYDTFRGRIIFPVYSPSGYIAGFSGRYIGADKEVPKYLNTSETGIYHKSDLLFGWRQARKAIAETRTVILTEGNPDTLRLHQIGKTSTIAPCGTAFTETQADMIARAASNAIIVGDTDKAGIEAVRKEGEMLVARGMNVRVMELPHSTDAAGNHLKVDADEYFMTHAHDWDNLMANDQCTQDYIPWACRAIMEGRGSQTEKAEGIAACAALVAKVKDEGAAMMYLEQLTREHRNGKIWTAEYYKARNRLEREEAKVTGADDMLRQYGFYERDNSYYGAGSSGSDRRWSNFVMRPILHIRDEKNARRIFLLINQRKQEAVVKLSQSELVSFTDFKTRTETAGNYVWEATANELTKLKKMLYDNTPSADEIRQLGWQKAYGFWAWGNGGWDGGTFRPVNEYGIVEIRGGRYYLPGAAIDTKDNTSGYQQARRFVYIEETGGLPKITLRAYADMLVRCFGDNAKIALCFLFATLFRDIVTQVTTSFPILNLFGQKGTGKSELGHSLTSFFVAGGTAPNISNTTKAALAEAVAEVSNAVVHLDEYKNNIDLEKREFLKGLWDGTGRSRMNMDNDRRRETTAVDCGVVMSGQEMPTADIALFNRLVFLTFSKTTFSDDDRQAFDALVRVQRRGLQHLTCQLLASRGRMASDFRHNWEMALADLNNALITELIEDRTLRNWATLLAAFRCIEPDIDVPFGYAEIRALMSQLCREQNEKTHANNELSTFWEIVGVLAASAKIWNEVDFKIMVSNGKPIATKESLKAKSEGVIVPAGRQYLVLYFPRVGSMYTKEAKDGGGRIVPKETLRYYLEHSPEYLGTKTKEWFRKVDDSTGRVSVDNNGRAKRYTGPALMFDYPQIVEHYELDLAISYGNANEAEIETLTAKMDASSEDANRDTLFTADQDDLPF